MITWILQTKFVLNFFLKVILIYHCHSEIFELSHIFKGYMSCLFFYYDQILHHGGNTQIFIKFSLRLCLHQIT